MKMMDGNTQHKPKLRAMHELALTLKNKLFDRGNAL